MSLIAPTLQLFFTERLITQRNASPQTIAAYRNTILEAVLPVSIARSQPDPENEVITEGFRPALTQVGAASSIFRFSPDRVANEHFLKEELQPIFWYAKGITVKPQRA